jgi:hypothetical protein
MGVTPVPAPHQGSVTEGMLWMSGLSLVLWWIPLIGPFIAGYVGGSRAGSVGRALVATILPGVILTVAVGFSSAALSGMPLVGFLAGFGTLMLIAGNIGPMLVGAILGGFMA